MDTCTAIGKISLPNATSSDIVGLQFALDNEGCSRTGSVNILLATILFKNLDPKHLATQNQNVITIWGQKIWIGAESPCKEDENKYVLEIGGQGEMQNNTAYFTIDYLDSYLPLNEQLFAIEGSSGLYVNGYNFLKHIFQFVDFAE